MIRRGGLTMGVAKKIVSREQAEAYLERTLRAAETSPSATVDRP